MLNLNDEQEDIHRTNPANELIPCGNYLCAGLLH